MKKSFMILVSAAMVFSLAAAAVRAQDDQAAAETATGNAESVSEKNTSNNEEATVNSMDAKPAPIPAAPAAKPAEKRADPAAAGVNPKLIKIPAPEYLKYFRDIKKVGDSLYGIVKNGVSDAMTAAPQVSDASATEKSLDSLASRVEKILSPEMIKNYMVVKKEGNALFGVKLSDLPSILKGAVPVKRAAVSSEQAGCVIDAIKAKDTAVSASIETHAASLRAAVSARTSCQSAALGAVEGQGEALAACVSAFVKSSKAAKEDLSKARETAWSAYRTALKACQNATASSSPAQEIMVEDGGDQML